MNELQTMHNDERWMRRCFDLARLGAGDVSPNPMVGAVLVHEGRIIGEGWHRQYGEAHAEVNCIASVSLENQPFIPCSTLYCSLEPCFHFGKTPPCVDLILQRKISRVAVSVSDPNPLVAGRSLEKLRAAGVEVVSGILAQEGLWLNRAFMTWISERRPHIILKWAKSSDGFIGKPGERTAISGPAALRLTHRWRSESDAILVGAATALSDNPRLDTRYYFGKNPLRIVFDRAGKIPAGFHLLNDSTATWVFGKERAGVFSRTSFFDSRDKVLIPNLLNKLAEAKFASLLVEGGANVLAQFLDTGYWDEIRVIENSRRLGGGVAAPQIPVAAVLKEHFVVGSDAIWIFGR